MTAPSALNDRCAGAYLVSALRSDVEGMLATLLEVAQAGGIRGLVDFVDALAATARDLIEQLGADRAEDLLRQQLLAAAIEDAQQRHHHRNGEHRTMPTPTTTDLHGRREQLNAQLADLRSQHVGITADVGNAEQDWKQALAAGEDTTLISERRRVREAELDECNRAIDQVTAWIVETDAELRRREPHEQLDRDLQQLTADLAAYHEFASELDGAHQAAIDKVTSAAEELHQLVTDARRRHDELAGRSANLRSTAAQLDRPDVTVPAPANWSQPVEQTLHGSGAPWRVYLTSVQNRTPEPLSRALGEAAAISLATRIRAEQKIHRNIR